MFDNQLIIEGGNGTETRRFFKSKQIQSTILEAFETKKLFYIGINELDVDFVPILNGKSHLSIFITREWILDDSIIEKMFDFCEKVNNLLRIN